jgi:hypothetical protein
LGSDPTLSTVKGPKSDGNVSIGCSEVIAGICNVVDDICLSHQTTVGKIFSKTSISQLTSHLKDPSWWKASPTRSVTHSAKLSLTDHMHKIAFACQMSRERRRCMGFSPNTILTNGLWSALPPPKNLGPFASNIEVSTINAYKL